LKKSTIIIRYAVGDYELKEIENFDLSACDNRRGVCGVRFSRRHQFFDEAGDGFSGSDLGSLRCNREGHEGRRRNLHVGIVARDANGQTIVLEAVSKGVVATDLQTFLNRSVDTKGRPKVMAGRLKKPYRHLIPAAIKEAEALKGKPYDRSFEIDNDAYYCSELMRFSWATAASRFLN
jgi:hypothetical protein